MKRTTLAAALLFFVASSSATTKAATCGFTSVVGLSFGSYDVYGGNLDSAGSIAYQCTGVLPADTVTIELTIGGAPSYTPRQLQSGPNRLDYNIYLDASRVTIWGNGTGGSARYGPITPTEGSTTTVPTYGRIPSGQDATIGAYADTIVVTMSF